MITIIIPAKGGSTRLPNKNMIMLNDRPMIDYSIDLALASKKAGDIYVTTDTEAIAEHARSRGLKVVMRPESLGGDVGLLDVYRHALKQIGDNSITTIVGVQPDHPDREKSVDDSITAFQEAGPDCDVLYSTEPDGTKSGSHFVISRSFLESEREIASTENKVVFIDDCTNVHYQEDLDKASARLKGPVTA